jgi:hypothetical protein
MAAGMTQTPRSERRRAPRIQHRATLSIVNPRQVIQAQLLDLSDSGVSCTLNQFVPLMTKFQLHFALPRTQEPIRCSGVVVRIRPPQAQNNGSSYEAAIFFSDLSDTDRQAIHAFVQHRLSGQQD